ncbi:HNH endonuclease [Jatrophihabitans cynanchi]|uniref:HNH endonuclease n=1 Tax=Jatrophihabitans cynanchi TaxID=2944128 RepID=A0ABY7JRC3_9ACTN|nr:HNH endonuclease signature motif containing protein [Jatrophihabitans sp. SB3-54]WAX55103.1 HNH endonuclease [Jatrophihabitans sp. SB3-54]
MAISDHDRKVLWARAHNSCAICKRILIADSTTTDRESIVGDEAHIAARSTIGPRGGVLAADMTDSYDNLILLCKVDHKRVDDQPQEYTAERLRAIKAEHERWAADKFGASEPEPIRIVDPSDGGAIELAPLANGAAIWDVVANSQAYRLRSPEDGSDEEIDQADTFLDLARDWGEISDDVIDQGMTAVRQAKRSLQDGLDGLHRIGLVVFGARRQLVIKGGQLPPGSWCEAVLVVYRRADIPTPAEGG